MFKGRWHRLMPICLLTSWLAGCSAHPLPEDSTGFDTVQIVAKCRCEVRDGARDFLTSALLDPRRLAYFPQYAELANGLRDGTLRWEKLREHLKRYRVDETTMGVFERYASGAIAYEFIFDMSEKNGAQGGLDFLGPLSGGTFSAGINASASLNRRNERTVNSADNFEQLITAFNEDYCGPNSENGTKVEDRASPKLVYPITGSLKLYEMVGTFLNLNQSGNLTGLSNLPGEAALIPTVSENMKFTTTFTSGGALGFTAAPNPRSVRLSKASVTSFGSERQDIHTLRVVMKLPLKSLARTRTIAEERLASLGVPQRRAELPDLLKYVAVADLSLSAEKQYLEAKLRAVQDLNLILPD